MNEDENRIPFENNWKYTKISDIEDLSVRAINLLGHFTLSEVDSMSDKDLFKIPKLGRKTIREIRDLISEYKNPSRPEYVIMHAKDINEVLQWAVEHETTIRAIIKGELLLVPKGTRG